MVARRRDAEYVLGVIAAGIALIERRGVEPVVNDRIGPTPD